MARPIDEFLLAWNSLSGSAEQDGWRSIPVTPAGPCVLQAGRRFPGNEESLLAGFSFDYAGPALGCLGLAALLLVPYFSPGMPALYAAAITNGLLFALSGTCLQNLVGLQGHSGDSARTFSNKAFPVS